MTTNLAPVFLDDEPVPLTDADARPKLDAILAALGKPEDTKVRWRTSPSGGKARDLRSEEVVDRTAEPTKPIYLTSGDAAGSGSLASRSGSDAAMGKEWRDPSGSGRFADAGEDSDVSRQGSPEAVASGEDRPDDLQTEGKAVDLQTESTSRAHEGDEDRSGAV